MGKKGSDEILCPEWMLTMGDAMSLLLTFFVLLLTFSSKDKDKLDNVLGFVKGALSAVNVNTIATSVTVAAGHIERIENSEEIIKPHSAKVKKSKVSPIILHSVEMKNMFDEYERKLLSLGKKNNVSLNMLDQGMKIDVPLEDIFEENGQWTQESGVILQGIGNLGSDSGNELRLLVCLPESEVNKSIGQSSGWNLAIEHVLRIGAFFRNRFDMHYMRFGYGVQVLPPGEKPRVTFYFMEKLGVNEVSLEKLWRDRQKRTAKEVGVEE